MSLREKVEGMFMQVGEKSAQLSLKQCCFLAAYEPEIPEGLEEMFESEEE